MRCDKALEIIEDCLDGATGGVGAEIAAAHISACDYCSERVEELQAELDFYRRYRREIEAPAEMWQAIRSALRDDDIPPLSRRAWLKPAASILELLRTTRKGLAFGLAAAVIVGIAVGVRWEKRDSSPQPTVVPAIESADNNPTITTPKTAATQAQLEPAVPSSTRIDPVRRSRDRVNHAAVAERQFRATMNALLKDLNQRRAKLDPLTLGRFETALTALDRTIEDTRQAVREHPGNPIALEYMKTAYSKKMEVIEVIKEMTAAEPLTQP